MPLYIAIAIGIVMFTKNTKYYRSWDGRKTAEMPSLSTEEPTFKRRLISAFIGVAISYSDFYLFHFVLLILSTIWIYQIKEGCWFSQYRSTAEPMTY